MGFRAQLRCVTTVACLLTALRATSAAQAETSSPSGPSALIPDGLTLTPAQSNYTRPQMLQQSIGNPADAARGSEARPAGTNDFGGVHTWEMPPVDVVGARSSELREEDRVGSYAQPRWTTDRRFSETRVYVIPEGKFEFEYWFIPTVNRHGPSEIRQQFEAEIGLPHRFQLDLYLSPRKEGENSPTFLDNSVEVRYAFADWNVIWGNPTLYVEYTFGDQAPDAIEAKLLLGGEIAPRWHWGADLSFEHAVSGDRSNEYEFTSGVSYTLIDERFSVGVEEKLAFTDTHHHRGAFEHELFVGPSFQYRPIPRMHIDVAPLIGIGHESPGMQAFVIVGWEF